MIDVSRYRQKTKVLNEYPAFAKDPVIGDAITDDPEVVLFGTVCHEVAHWAQLNSRLARKMKRYKGTFRKSHGKCFQSIYRYLRVALVNPLVKKSQVKVVEETLNSKAFVEAGIDANGNVGHEVLQFKDVLLKDLDELAGDKVVLSATATRMRKHKI